MAGIGGNPTRLALLLAPLLVLLLGLLGWHQYRQERAAILSEQTRLAGERHFAVAAMLADADRQLRRMETRMAGSIAASPGLGGREGELVAVSSGGVEATEWAGAAIEQGNLIGLPDLARRARGPVAAALDLLPTLALEARIAAGPREGAPAWSYFFSAAGDFITILPGARLGDFLAAAPRVPDAAALIAHWLAYPVFRLGTPEANPDRAPYWTPPYDDAGGAGRMVSHAMPVYDGARFLGIVGTDIPLAAFGARLRPMASPLGAIGLVDGAGELLAGDLAGAVPEGAGQRFERMDGEWVLARGFPGTPFRLVTVIPEAELGAVIWPSLIGPGLLLLGATAALALVLVWFDRRHLRPGLALAAYAEAAASARDTPPEPPADLPPGWAARAGAVARAFAAARADRAALVASEARYRNVVDTQTELVARHTPDGRATFANPAYCRQLGQSLATVLASEQSQFDFIAPEDHSLHEAHLASLTPEHPTATITIKVWLPRGSGDFWEEWTDTGIFDAEGRMVELQSVGRDVTEKVRAEEELRRQREALHQSEKLAALGSLLAGVAHELNNPLSIVVGYAGMLTELAEDEATRRRAGEIARAADRCARIVRTFLAMARARPAEKCAVDLGAVADQVLELAAYGLRANGIEVALVGGAPGVLADPDQIHQVVMNVILNAQQAMMETKGPRRLTIGLGESEGRAVIEIADTGPGLAPAIADRVFDPFFTTKPQGIGTGIGLAVSRGIIEAHGGAITLRSLPGGGALCRIELPGAEAAGDAPVPAPGTRPGGKERVLVVDDEPALGALLAEVLTRAGYRAEAMTDPEAALRAGADFDAVLADLRMPGLGGAELAERLVARTPRLQGRILLMTGDALRTPASGRWPLLEKPVDPEILLEAVSRALALQGS